MIRQGIFDQRFMILISSIAFICLGFSMKAIKGSKNDENQISVMTFNVWDLFVAKERELRMKIILSDLIDPTPCGSIRTHDIIAFQEMWTVETYNTFKYELEHIYPHSHNYQYTSLGSGLSIFSKHPIISTDFHGFSINGRPMKVFDGDWFAGKGIGHARILHPSGLIDVFTTHLAADYSNETSRPYDDYLSDRILQLWEVVKFIRLHEYPSSVGTIFMGDLNTEMNLLPWKTFFSDKSFTHLQSIYDELNRDQIPITCNQPSNPYTSKRNRAKTIDHILFAKLKFISLSPAFTKVPYQKEKRSGLKRFFVEEKSPAAFSDHCAITAQFMIDSSLSSSECLELPPALISVSESTQQFLVQSLHKIYAQTRQLETDRAFYSICSWIMLGFFIFFLYTAMFVPGLDRWLYLSILLLIPILTIVLVVLSLLVFSYYPGATSNFKRLSLELDTLIA